MLNLKALRLIRKIKARKLTYLNAKRLGAIARCLSKINARNVHGIVVEAGCALGGSLALIAEYSGSRPVYVYDTFEQIPEPSEKDAEDAHQRYAIIRRGLSEGIGGETYYGYRTNLLTFVEREVAHFHGESRLEEITFVPGLLQETMEIPGPVAFAHIDVDWYEPVLVSLERIWPNLSPGGFVIVDDYSDWSGCKSAVDEFFRGRRDFKFNLRSGNLVIEKPLSR